MRNAIRRCLWAILKTEKTATLIEPELLQKSCGTKDFQGVPVTVGEQELKVPSFPLTRRCMPDGARTPRRATGVVDMGKCVIACRDAIPEIEGEFGTHIAPAAH